MTGTGLLIDHKKGKRTITGWLIWLGKLVVGKLAKVAHPLPVVVLLSAGTLCSLEEPNQHCFLPDSTEVTGDNCINPGSDQWAHRYGRCKLEVRTGEVEPVDKVPATSPVVLSPSRREVATSENLSGRSKGTGRGKLDRYIGLDIVSGRECGGSFLYCGGQNLRHPSSNFVPTSDSIQWPLNLRVTLPTTSKSQWSYKSGLGLSSYCALGWSAPALIGAIRVAGMRTAIVGYQGHQPKRVSRYNYSVIIRVSPERREVWGTKENSNG